MTTQSAVLALQQPEELTPARDWTLTATAFEMLLEQLDDNRDRAAHKYVSLYTKLTRYFDWRGCDMPDWHADETMARVARKIEQGANITNFQGFMFGVARKVVLEAAKQREKEQAILKYLCYVASLEDFLDKLLDQDDLHSRLEAGLLQLTPKNRELLLEYFASSDEKNMEVRRKLAQREGISLNGLRVKVHRLKLTLETYVKSGLDGVVS